MKPILIDRTSLVLDTEQEIMNALTCEHDFGMEWLEDSPTSPEDYPISYEAEVCDKCRKTRYEIDELIVNNNLFNFNY